MFLDYTFAIYPTVDTWLQLMNDIRTIFEGSMDDSPAFVTYPLAEIASPDRKTLKKLSSCP
jgi:hypothetical protein